MFSIDDHAGNTVFMVAATIFYVARGAFLVLFLSLLFAYLLEPAVTCIEHHSRLGQKSRTWAIAQVYLVGTLVLGGLGYEFGPHVVAQIKNLNAAVPGILDGISSGRTAASLGSSHGLSAAQQQWIKNQLAGNHDFIAHVFERSAASAAYVAETALWLFIIPILAIFILRDGRQMVDSIVDSIGPRADRPQAKRIFGQIETMLAKFIRAQLALAALSFVFYSVSMLLLGFPYAVALGVFGGALEFLPAVGWIASAAAILTIGFLTHSHWIWMAALIVVWRLVQDYVNSPRIMGDSLELEPLAVVFAVMVGGQLGGIPGLYLSVPAVAVLRIVWIECRTDRTSTSSYPDRPLMRARV
jgi:predicted PurR-regulated permease PerM